MPSSQSGAAPGMRDVVRELREHKRQIDILFRRLSVPAKLPTPVVAAGGIVGQAEIVSSGGVVFPAGATEMTYYGVTYGTPNDVNAGTEGESTVPISDWLTVDGYQLYVTTGWYIPVLYQRVLWDDINDAPPAFGGPYTYGGWDSVHNDYGIHPRIPFGGSDSSAGGFQQIANYGPTYVHEGSDFHAELRPVGGVVAGVNNDDPYQSRIIWDITKLT